MKNIISYVKTKNGQSFKYFKQYPFNNFIDNQTRNNRNIIRVHTINKNYITIYLYENKKFSQTSYTHKIMYYIY